MSKKKQKMRHERNVGLQVARDIKEGRLTTQNTGNIDVFNSYIEALEPLPDHINEYVEGTFPVVLEALKQKQKVYLLFPGMQIKQYRDIHGSKVITGIPLVSMGGMTKGKECTFSVKSIYDGDNAVLMANENCQVYTPTVEKIIIEKETEKRISTGVKPKDIDKAIDKT